jgi:hypothetical protein
MAKAKWTVMIFLNADNNLEPFGISDFREMANVGSSSDVNIALQFDRNGSYATTSPQWSGCHRFLVKKGMRPQPSDAIQHLGDTNMGDGQVLRNFVDWAMSTYPAERYMLEIWNHGQGWRNFQVRPAEGSETDVREFTQFRKGRIETDAQRRSARSSRSIEQHGADLAARPQSIPHHMVAPNTVRYVSLDETSNDKLYNREIQDALLSLATRLDLFGFDACLMAMIETAYALRNVAKVMVASEELTPGDGWKYSDWIGLLRGNPDMDANDLGRTLVKSYRRSYRGVDETVTLSSVELSKMDAMARSIDTLADALVADLRSGKLQEIRKARAVCEEFAPGYGLHGIDLGYLCEAIKKTTGLSVQSTAAASSLLQEIGGAVIANYAGEDRQQGYGSTGLAVYFPQSKALFNTDPEREGYLKSNKHFPVEFVQKHRWADFLQAYYGA